MIHKFAPKLNFIICSLLINNFSFSLSNQVPYLLTSSIQDELVLHSPIQFTPNGLQCFLKHTYNHPKYGVEILPHNTGHLIQMLDHGKRNQQDHEYMCAVIRLFRQKLSASPYLSASELERILTLLPLLLENHLGIACTNLAKPGIKKGQRKLQSLTIRLIENVLGKTLWDAHQPSEMLKEFLAIGNGLETLYKQRIVTDIDDLNDLIHMLIDRFSYVLDLTGADLPQQFYLDLRQQLETAPWLQIAEIEDLIQSKQQKMQLTILKNQVRATAVLT